MARPSHLSPDNILRFLQVRTRSCVPRRYLARPPPQEIRPPPLFKMLGKLKKRGAIREFPGGRYHLSASKRRTRHRYHSLPATLLTGSASIYPPPRRTHRPPRPPSRRLRLRRSRHSHPSIRRRHLYPPRSRSKTPCTAITSSPRFSAPASGTALSAPKGASSAFSSRAHPTVVGLFRYGPRVNSVLPYDARMQHAVEIPPGDEFTPELAKQLGLPVPSASAGGDRNAPSRASRRIPRLEELDGAVVNVEILRFPRGGSSPTGRVIEILGRPGDLGVDIEIIIRKHHLPHFFPPEVISEAERLAATGAGIRHARPRRFPSPSHRHHRRRNRP